MPYFIHVFFTTSDKLTLPRWTPSTVSSRNNPPNAAAALSTKSQNPVKKRRARSRKQTHCSYDMSRTQRARSLVSQTSGYKRPWATSLLETLRRRVKGRSRVAWLRKWHRGGRTCTRCIGRRSRGALFVLNTRYFLSSTDELLACCQWHSQH